MRSFNPLGIEFNSGNYTKGTYHIKEVNDKKFNNLKSLEVIKQDIPEIQEFEKNEYDRLQSVINRFKEFIIFFAIDYDASYLYFLHHKSLKFYQRIKLKQSKEEINSIISFDVLGDILCCLQNKGISFFKLPKMDFIKDIQEYNSDNVNIINDGCFFYLHRDYTISRVSPDFKTIDIDSTIRFYNSGDEIKTTNPRALFLNNDVFICDENYFYFKCK